MNKDAIERELSPLLRRDVFEAIGFKFPRRCPDDGQVNNVLGPSELGEGEKPNFSVNLSTGLAKDHGSGGWEGDLYKAVAEVHGLTFPEALEWLADFLALEDYDWDFFEDGEETAAYQYRDRNGNVMYEVVRHDVRRDHPAWPDKDFRQRVPGKGWGLKKHGVPWVLYRTPVLHRTLPGKVVFICEGEKDVHTLEGHGLTATCNPGGAGKWRRGYNAVFEGAMVVILPDNDAAGRRHARQVAEGLHGVAEWVKVIELPGLPPKGDVTDWFEAGGTAAELKRIVKNAPRQAAPPKPEPEEFENAESFEAMLRERRGEGALIGTYAEGVKRRVRRILAGEANDYMPTCFKTLDAKADGLRRGHLNLFCAISGAGKTAFMLQVIMHTILRTECERRVVMFSAEMKPEELYMRLASMRSHVNLRELRKQKLIEAERERFFEALNEVEEWPLYVDAHPRPTLLHMYRVLRREDDGTYALVCVDYIEKVQTSGQGEQQLSQAAQGISEIAKFWPEVPNLTNSQLTVRGLKKGSGYRGSSQQIRYSQKLYDESSVVYILHSDDALVKHGIMEPSDAAGGVEVHVAKNRDGDAGMRIPMDFLAEYTYFEDRTEKQRSFNEAQKKQAPASEQGEFAF